MTHLTPELLTPELLTRFPERLPQATTRDQRLMRRLQEELEAVIVLTFLLRNARRRLKRARWAALHG
jgi:hypothetical protein